MFVFSYRLQRDPFQPASTPVSGRWRALIGSPGSPASHLAGVWQHLPSQSHRSSADRSWIDKERVPQMFAQEGLECGRMHQTRCFCAGARSMCALVYLGPGRALGTWQSPAEADKASAVLSSLWSLHLTPFLAQSTVLLPQGAGSLALGWLNTALQ